MLSTSAPMRLKRRGWKKTQSEARVSVTGLESPHPIFCLSWSRQSASFFIPCNVQRNCHQNTPNLVCARPCLLWMPSQESQERQSPAKKLWLKSRPCVIYLTWGCKGVECHQYQEDPTLRWIRSLPTRAKSAPPTSITRRKSTLQGHNVGHPWESFFTSD